MAIPLIIGGAALAAGIFGAKKGYDAKKNYDEAKNVVEDAKDKLDEAQNKLDFYKNETTQSLQKLGAVRLTVEADLLKRFVELVKPINNVQYKAVKIGDTRPQVSLTEIQSMEADCYKASDLLKDGVAAISSGVLTGIGVGGLASTIGVASTGTAITSLTGVAATNATLAWLGGGALTSGGMGMVGGATVLGGAIAGPVIAIIGFAAAKKSEKALTNAYEHAYEIKSIIEQINNGVIVLKSMISRADEINQVILALSQRFQVILEQAEEMIYRKLKSSTKKSINFDSFSEAERDLYEALISFGLALNALLRVQVFENDGSVSSENQNIKKAHLLLGGL